MNNISNAKLATKGGTKTRKTLGNKMYGHYL
jgi:hypothetical protein